MATITAADVNKLRTITGAGMMDCKKALVEAEGDFDLAIENLRKKGQKVAANRSDRESTEGAVIAAVNADKTVGVVVSLNCETDFVGKNEGFVKLATDFAALALNFDTKEAFLAADYNGITVAEKLIEQTGVIGEKIEIGAFERLEGAFIGSYIHAGNKIATLTALSKNIEGADEVAKNISMQAAAMAPIALNEDGVDAETIAKEIEIAKDVLRQEGKPEAMLDNIAKGKLARFFKDNTLVNQDYIKDNKLSVAAYAKTLDKDLVVTGFRRAALG
ncbi:translation elongation factor Ts [Flavobacterium branchiophilum NBRC 15030 = ATCC 35035]|uniref:Elongation factor Ts n=2 Tax=Flavobacterium branchiophilum TaxID=55197 RepID=G2Z416_FLABF|nr:translation elongation factor Ts [Flavobacterium branchiophilum]OXA77614.1 translation elongation factor Ts [Flavobacterium branchiophilum NBRC 15030 = ATCC 35035]PDS23069.1 elongation factor Ts [Flavobacterium branchiophilum]TQM40702.1 translation elongation factor Ts (EF-Ts) [Flavobacterium branchiophilum]CCB68352.1 Elongation factor Ts (EF-Ts) [Flavobacterium branchiophilum FL-15]GEM54219.1 elongation factor Ts [Flavobacterium branchiophilum NBRC 15030 = ATCC 35035]